MSKVLVFFQQTRPTSPSRVYCEGCKPPTHPSYHDGSGLLTNEDLTSAFGIEDMCPHLLARLYADVTPAPDAPE